jgi:hypothetical protein
MRGLAAAFVLLAGSGCGLAAPAGRSVSEAYGSGHELRVLDGPSPLRREAKIPVLSAPEVFAAYVPSHADRDLLVGEHWIFFRLRDAEWFIERLADPEPPADGEAPAEALRPLRDLEWSRVVVPHRSP